MTVEEYLKETIASFEHDPADTLFQEGYKAALEDLQIFLSRQENKTD